MHRNKWLSVLLVGVLVIATVVTSTASLRTSQAQEPKVLRTAFLPGDVKFDPSLATDSNSIQLLNEVYIGLTSLNEESAIEPGIASSWDVSADGLTYTFHLIPGIPWVRYDADANAVVQVTDDAGNALTVTAQDVVYGWLRTLDPATASEYAGVLSAWVVGGQELLDSEVTGDELQALKDLVGIKALDDNTVQVTSARTAGFVPMVYGLWMARPQLQSVVEEYGDSWTEAGTYPSYGPYALKAWEHDVDVTLIKNPFWPGTDSVPQAKIDEILATYMGDESAMLAAYEAGEVDWLSTIPLSELDRMRAERPSELNIAPRPCTYYYGFNVLTPPVDNVHMRRALSMAIDRQALVQILNGGQQPALFFSRPGLAAAPLQETYPDLAIKSDPEGARAELQAYFDETGTTLESMPSITLMHNVSGTHAIIAQAAQQMWKETLGIDVQITTQDFAVYQDTLQDNAPQIFRMGWCSDYSDDHNFLYDVFRFPATSGVGLNYANWEDPEYQKLLDEAMVLSDNAVREQMYAQADGILVNGDAAIAPLYFYTFQQMTQTYVDRTFSKNGNERLESGTSSSQLGNQKGERFSFASLQQQGRGSRCTAPPTAHRQPIRRKARRIMFQ